MRKKIKRIVPFILVGVLVSSFVMTNYNKARVAKAAFVVDDIALMVALFAMCGITYTGLEYYYANGQWLDENDSPVADNDTQKQLDGLLDRSKKHWDEEVRKKAIAQGLIDEDGNILNNGSSGSSGGDNDDNNKFPSWDKLKEKVAKSGGNVALAVSSLLPFVALYSYGALEKSGSYLADKLIDDGINIDENYITKDTRAIFHCTSALFHNLHSDDGESITKYISDFLVTGDVLTCAYRDGNNIRVLKLANGDTDYILCFNNGAYLGRTWALENDKYIDKFYANGEWYKYNDVCINSSTYNEVSVKLFCSLFDTKEGAMNYMKENIELNGKSDVFNPVTIGQDSSLRDAMKENGDYPTSPIHSNVKLPSTDKLKELIKNLKSTSGDNDGRQNVVDDFIKDLTTPDDSGGVSPNPNPTPDPSNPDSGGSGGTGTDNPDDTDKSNFTRDLRLVFPFCIPFDLVDCIRLFSSEPETPKIDFPIHFPIVNVDYTFTIDLRDFNGVAMLCRSMFLILFIVGLVLATRPLIRG